MSLLLNRFIIVRWLWSLPGRAIEEKSMRSSFDFPEWLGEDDTHSKGDTRNIRSEGVVRWGLG